MTAHFEAKLHGFRRTQDGVVISYVVHPNDLSREMALAPLGTRYMVAFSEIGDDDKPVEAPKIGDFAGVTDLMRGESQKKDRKPFASLPLSQQAAIRCGDADFQKFIVERYSGFHAYRVNEDNAALLVREQCGVTSRSKIVYPGESGEEWSRLEGEYQSFLTTQRYAHVMRK